MREESCPQENPPYSELATFTSFFVPVSARLLYPSSLRPCTKSILASGGTAFPKRPLPLTMQKRILPESGFTPFFFAFFPPSCELSVSAAIWPTHRAHERNV